MIKLFLQDLERILKDSVLGQTVLSAY